MCVQTLKKAPGEKQKAHLLRGTGSCGTLSTPWRPHCARGHASGSRIAVRLFLFDRDCNTMQVGGQVTAPLILPTTTFAVWYELTSPG